VLGLVNLAAYIANFSLTDIINLSLLRFVGIETDQRLVTEERLAIIDSAELSIIICCINTLCSL
jgi:hypothetical protein